MPRSLYIYVDELLGQHPCYLVDCLEGRIVVVTGLAGDSGAEQAEAALGFAKGLQEAAGRIKLSETSNMQLLIGVHSCAAQVGGRAVGGGGRKGEGLSKWKRRTVWEVWGCIKLSETCNNATVQHACS